MWSRFTDCILHSSPFRWVANSIYQNQWTDRQLLLHMPCNGDFHHASDGMCDILAKCHRNSTNNSLCLYAAQSLRSYDENRSTRRDDEAADCLRVPNIFKLIGEMGNELIRSYQHTDTRALAHSTNNSIYDVVMHMNLYWSERLWTWCDVTIHSMCLRLVSEQLWPIATDIIRFLCGFSPNKFIASDVWRFLTLADHTIWIQWLKRSRISLRWHFIWSRKTSRDSRIDFPFSEYYEYEVTQKLIQDDTNNLNMRK